MNKNDLERMTRQFILSEGHAPPSIISYVQALQETLENLTPRSRTDERRLQIAKEICGDIRRSARRLEIKIKTLEEQETK